jgi:iron complex outermembrane receptor protein
MLKTPSAIAILLDVLATSSAYAQTAAAPAGASVTNQPGSPAQSSGASKSTEPVAPEDILHEIVIAARPSIAGDNMIVQREPEPTSSISAAAISERMALTGPLQLIATVPGINATATDPFEMSQRTNIYIRGLPATEQGWLVDGAPAVSQAFFLPYSETWTDPENFAGLTGFEAASIPSGPLELSRFGQPSKFMRAGRDTRVRA